MPAKRTHHLRTDIILSECDHRGWEFKDLAEAAKVDPKTITLVVQRGEKASMNTLNRICAAINKRPNDLISRNAVVTKGVARICQVTLVLTNLPDDFSLADAEALIAELKARYNADAELVLRAVATGSTLLLLDANTKGAICIVDDMMFRRLDRFNLESIQITGKDTRWRIPAEIHRRESLLLHYTKSEIAVKRKSESLTTIKYPDGVALQIRYADGRLRLRKKLRLPVTVGIT